VESLGHTLHHFEANFITREKINQITLEAKLWLEQNP
jgi:hypothetical protein